MSVDNFVKGKSDSLPKIIAELTICHKYNCKCI